VIALALLLLQTAQPPVLAFPEPGLDDTAAYQGYQTRFYRDSKGNTVQIYLEPRGARVVNLWADAADESLGFTVRDAGGRAARLDWASDGADARDSGDVRTLEWRLAVGSTRATIGWFLLGSMRVERDFQYAKAHLKPFSAPPFYVAEESLLVANLARLPAGERARQLPLLAAGSVAALRARLLPTVAGGCSTVCRVRIERPSLDGRTHLSLELSADPREAAMVVGTRTVTFRSRSKAPLRITVRIGTDAAALTPLVRDSIFTRPFLDFLATAQADSAGRGRRLEREVRSIELLSSEEKLMAGLPNFDTYFGRDMLMAALMMRPIWRPAMSEHVIASALRKLSPRGDVSHEEALAGQAIRENAAEYNRLVAAYSALASRDPAAAGDTLARARELLASLPRTRENYYMRDDEFQLPILEARYLADSTVPAARKRAFLLEDDTTGATRLALMLREIALVAEETRAYTRDPRPENLVSFERRDSTHWRSASWRDSDAGYAGGRFAMDINAIWAPRALEAVAAVLAALPALGFERGALDSLVPGAGGEALAAYRADSASLRQAIHTWRGARRHFVVRLGPEEIARRLATKLAWMPAEERAHWRAVLDSSRAGRDSLVFLALSLDSAGTPIPVVNTDPATELFLDATSTDSVRMDQVPTMLRPYPVGLLVEGLGPLVANDAYAERRVWNTFAKDPYHGPRVVWGREMNLLLLGLAAVQRGGPAGAPFAREAADASSRILAAVRASGLEHSELWSYRIEAGRLIPTRYGTGSDVQLWSSTDLAVQFMRARLPHQ